ncbi:TonB-dependent receptor [Aureibacter tunicatorum]|uniref:Ferric aerobactin receptor n=1 Tax=Aureibacter tunicatorum TaxID=866807 RepID=A0AAE4BRP0_9BACT|nr:TonB-dependent receptor [Aureibacter tunicatorum]MDR6238123.1 hypothetical protein [Aureibacter tunicatorum]
MNTIKSYLQTKKVFLLFMCLFAINAIAQEKGVIKGKVVNKLNNEPIPFANVAILGTSLGSITDEKGLFIIDNLKPDLYNVQASSIGFLPQTRYEIRVTNARATVVNFELGESELKLDEVEVTASPFDKTEESPLSLRSIGSDEVRRMPGGNRDISKVIQSLPGVSTTVSFRNDIIIRGGAPSENKYYLDGIEIPVINHFQTQGASGGPVGMINVDFIDKVDFYSGAFPANRGNTLSSVFEFIQTDGNEDHFALNAVVGATDVGLTVQGPISDKTTYLFSARRSYLQFLFKALDLPFLPTYNDAQFKLKHKFDDKNQLTILGIGAIDNFELNTDANETREQRYTLNNLPVNEQWNYTVGAKYQHFRKDGFYTFVLSRSQLCNMAYKYKDNDSSSEDNKLLDYDSYEIGTKFRAEDYRKIGNYQLSYGINYEYAQFYTNNMSMTPTSGGPVTSIYESDLDLNLYGGYFQISNSYLDNKLTLSLGARLDGNDYSSYMSNPLDQFSPRVSASYQLNPRWAVNFNTGIYYQLPPFTTMGFRNNQQELVNVDNGLQYIRSKQIVGGFEYLANEYGRFTVEGFFKHYDQYPFLLRDSLNLANLGGDFGVIGNDEANSSGKGRSYGVEFMYQQRLWKGFYGIATYTWVRSEFTDKNGAFVPSSWDSRHLISLSGGKKFKRNWELGMRWRFNAGNPYTPYDVEATVNKANWDISGRSVPDYDQLNTQRLDASHSLDVRIDKKYYFDKWSLNIYFDIQNFYGYETQLQPVIDVQRDAAGVPITDPNNPSAYLYDFLDTSSGTTIPSVGIIIEL